MSILESSVRKNGHSRYMRRSSASRAPSSPVEEARDRRAEAVPARQSETRLAPGEAPRNGAQILDLARRLSRGRPRADVERGDLGDRRRGEEIIDEARRLVDEAAIGVHAPLRESLPPTSRNSCGGALPCESRVASSVAATSSSRLMRPICGLAYFAAITSPCSVRRICPFTVPGGCARMAS